MSDMGSDGPKICIEYEDDANQWKDYTRPHIEDPGETVPMDKDYHFMLSKIDYVTEPSRGIDSIDKAQVGHQVPVIRITGMDSKENSVSVFVHGYKPYFYFAIPLSFPIRKLLEAGNHGLGQIDAYLELIRSRLNARLAKKIAYRAFAGGGGKKRPRLQISANGEGLQGESACCVRSVTLEVKELVKTGYDEGKYGVFKVVCSIPDYVKTCRSILEEGFAWHDSVAPEKIQTYESNIAFVLRFMVDRGLRGMAWTGVRAGKFSVTRGCDSKTTTSVALRVNHEDVFGMDFNLLEWKQIAPIRILSIDIECKGRKGYFPEPEHDPVIQISNVLNISGGTSQDQARKYEPILFSLKETADVPGAKVLSFHTEVEMLLAWSKFILKSDPDIMIGYNVIDFDFHYLIKRAEALGIGKQFAMFGRYLGSAATLKASKFSSKGRGSSEGFELNIPGRCAFDVLSAVKIDCKFRYYNLNFVSREILGEQKDDVSHEQIPILFEGSSADRARIGRYCIKDSLLAWRIFKAKLMDMTYVNYARVSGIPFEWLTTRGEQIRVISLLLRKAKAKDMILFTKLAEKRVVIDDREKAYGGAEVLNPKRGFYDQPIITLDFSSLYPTIMIAHNTCYTTLIGGEGHLKRILEKHPNWKLGEDYEMAPTHPAFESIVPPDEEQGGDDAAKGPNKKGLKNPVYFVTKKHRMSLLAEILEEGLAARTIAKNNVKQAIARGDKQTAAACEGEQNALKRSNNSVYGFTGAVAAGEYACVEIASNVTAWGREMIHLTKKIVETVFAYKFVEPQRPGETDEQFAVRREAEKLVVVYGDTDSVMIKTSFPGFTEEEIRTAKEQKKRVPVFSGFKKAAEAGREMAKYISTMFSRPIELAFEKIYYPYLLIERKRYAGLYWTKPEKEDRLDTKGMETVRRDVCPLTTATLTTTLGMIMYDRNISGAIAHAKSVISRLYRREVDIAELVVCKSISKHIRTDQVNAEIETKRMEITDENELKKFDIEIKKKYYAERASSAHTNIAKRHMLKDPSTAPGLGSRVSYIVIQKHGKDVKVSDKAEEPLVAFQKGLPYDVDYYVQNQLMQPLGRLFEPVRAGLSKEIFFGEHTKMRVNELRFDVEHEKSSMMNFVYRAEKCIHCMTRLGHEDTCDSCYIDGRIRDLSKEGTNDIESAIPNGSKRKATSRSVPSAAQEKADSTREKLLGVRQCQAGEPVPLCRRCVLNGHSSETYLKTMKKHQKIEEARSQYWSQCQRCQQSCYREVVCSNVQCPIYFRRLKSDIDLKSSYKTLERFDAHSAREETCQRLEKEVIPEITAAFTETLQIAKSQNRANTESSIPMKKFAKSVFRSEEDEDDDDNDDNYCRTKVFV